MTYMALNEALMHSNKVRWRYWPSDTYAYMNEDGNVLLNKTHHAIRLNVSMLNADWYPAVD